MTNFAAKKAWKRFYKRFGSKRCSKCNRRAKMFNMKGRCMNCDGFFLDSIAKFRKSVISDIELDMRKRAVFYDTRS